MPTMACGWTSETVYALKPTPPGFSAYLGSKTQANPCHIGNTPYCNFARAKKCLRARSCKAF